MRPLKTRHAAHSLNDVARRLAPHLRIISASRPTPVLRDHNVIAVAHSVDDGRRAVLALEPLEAEDDKLGTVVMGRVTSATEPDAASGTVGDRATGVSADPEGVSRQVVPRIAGGGLVGAIIGALVIGGGAFLLGARGWLLVGSIAAGAMLASVWGAIWVTFAGFGGSDAYRQTFVDDDVSELTIVSLHTDDAEEARAAHERLASDGELRVLDVDRFGRVAPTPPDAELRRVDRIHRPD